MSNSQIVAADINSSYTFVAYATDYFSETNKSVYLSTVRTVLDFRRGGKGVAVGKVAENDNLFDVGLPVKMPLKMQCGTISITPTAANTPTFETVTFPIAFESTPVVVVTPRTASPGTQVTGVGVASSSSIGVDIYITKTNTTATSVYWIAIVNN